LFLFLLCNKILWILVLHVSCFCFYCLVSRFRFGIRHAFVFILIKKFYRLGYVCAHDTANVKFHFFTSMVFDAHHIVLDHHKSINIRKFGGMVNSPKGKTFIKHAWVKPILFYYWWCLTKIASNMVNGLFYFHPFQFLFNLFMFAYSCF
jgi:hypothetical protein